MDKIFIDALVIECTIGIHDWEQRIKQPIVLDIEIGFDNRKPAATDAIEDTVDYAQVVELAREVAMGRSFQLVETLAEAVCERVLRMRGVRSVSLRATKRVPSLGVGGVGICIQREKGIG